MLQNQTYNQPLLIKNDDGTPIDISAWSFTGSIKEKTTDTAPVLSFIINVIDALSGSIALYIPASAAWQLNKSKYTYDIIVNDHSVSPIVTTRILYGKLHVKSGVTSP